MKRISVFYHYFHPDPNVSSVHFSELCAGLAERGWDVTAHPGNRNVETPGAAFPPSEDWQGVRIRRIWRPGFGRSSGLGRVLAALWMIVRWSLLAFRSSRAPDVIVIGTDPILSVGIASVWRWVRPRTRIVHWCFDIYPEVAYADGLLKKDGLAARGLTALLKPSYRSCDLIADIGPCMRTHLRKYGRNWREATLVPWALAEPAFCLPTAFEERKKIFGASTLALMYSGTFGRAHSSDDMLELMALLENLPAHLAFSVKGQREAVLRAAAANRRNISFVPFASKQHLDERLASADIHIVSLRDEWTGMVIPSKFFGALAVGRPVLFCGSGASSLAIWIRQYGLGWVLEPGSAPEIATELRALAQNPAALQAIREHCHRIYQEHFSRQTTLARWNAELKSLEDL